MVSIISDCLNITEPFKYDSSISDVKILTNQPQNGTDLNTQTQTIITINNNGQYLLPSESFLYVKGRLLNADGTIIAKDTVNAYPDVVLMNNFFPFMYNYIKYTINDVEVENLTKPGIMCTLDNILRKKRTWNALDMCWSLDTNDGLPNYDDGYLYYPMPVLSAYELR